MTNGLKPGKGTARSSDSSKKWEKSKIYCLILLLRWVFCHKIFVTAIPCTSSHKILNLYQFRRNIFIYDIGLRKGKFFFLSVTVHIAWRTTLFHTTTCVAIHKWIYEKHRSSDQVAFDSISIASDSLEEESEKKATAKKIKSKSKSTIILVCTQYVNIGISFINIFSSFSLFQL